jgi:hypothetical protein
VLLAHCIPSIIGSALPICLTLSFCDPVQCGPRVSSGSRLDVAELEGVLERLVSPFCYLFML